MKNSLIIVLSLVLLTSCLKDEIPVKAPSPGDASTNQAELTSDYRYQIYYDFESNSFVHQNLKTEWDIAFDCRVGEYFVALNTSKASSVKVFQNVDFAAKTDTNGGVWLFDNPNGKLSETACGQLLENTTLYLFDLGYSHDGIHQGYSKLQIESLSNDSYSIKTAMLDNSSLYQSEIVKDYNYNLIHFSFTNGIVENIEPPKDTWDITFSQYTHVYEDGTPYLVTGILQNRNNVHTAEVFDKEFQSIEYADVVGYDFLEDINVIGYDWKTFTGSTFTTDPTMNFMVKNRNGYYYKLHFIDFYNDQGEKGFPLFEMQGL